MRAGAIIAAATAAGLVGIGLWAEGGTRKAREPDATVDHPADNVEQADLARFDRVAKQLQERSATLEQRLAQLQRERLDDGTGRMSADDPKARDPDDEAARALRELRRDPERYDAHVRSTALAVLGRAVDRQSPDDALTVRAQEQLTTLLADPTLAGSRPMEVQCGTELCRFVVQHDGHDGFETFRDEGVIGNALFGPAGFFDYDPQTGQTTVYVAQHGQSLPPLNDALSAGIVGLESSPMAPAPVP